MQKDDKYRGTTLIPDLVRHSKSLTQTYGDRYSATFPDAFPALALFPLNYETRLKSQGSRYYFLRFLIFVILTRFSFNASYFRKNRFYVPLSNLNHHML